MTYNVFDLTLNLTQLPFLIPVIIPSIPQTRFPFPFTFSLFHFYSRGTICEQHCQKSAVPVYHFNYQGRVYYFVKRESRCQRHRGRNAERRRRGGVGKGCPLPACGEFGDGNTTFWCILLPSIVTIIFGNWPTGRHGMAPASP